MRFLRTASTRRLLSTIVGAVVLVIAGTAIAVAASGSGPVPKRAPLASAVHRALSASSPKGITANITFTNNLIDSADFTGDLKDPILQGANGRMWLSQGHLRLELQSDNGDGQVVVNGSSFWISDPMTHTVYKGTLPADTSSKTDKTESVPTVAQIQKQLTALMRHVNLSGAQPTDVAGRPAYRLVVSPQHDGGLLGSARLAWDAIRGVPLEFGIYARGNSTPVIDLKATNISYGPVAASVFSISPPAGDNVTTLATGSHSTAAAHAHAKGAAGSRHGAVKGISGLKSVAAHVPFTLNAPASLVALPRHAVNLLKSGSDAGAVVLYGQNLGGIAVIEEKASGASSGSSGSSGLPDGLSVPTVSINGATGHELSTPLGTVLTFTHGGVSYTVIGSVPAVAAEQAARALTTP